MVESDEEFAELCSKLLKRVKKSHHPSESQNAPKSSTAARGKVKKAKPSGTKKQKKDGGSRQSEVGAIAGPDGDKAEERNGAAQSCLTSGLLQNDGSRADCREGGTRPPGPVSVKNLVLERMQQFKRAAPSRMKLESTESISEEHVGSSMACGSAQSDEALALALQMDVKEKPASLEDEGLFFCQLCQKDLTTMSSTLREQHVNRCLDQVESLGGSSAAPVVPSCPLCGKPFSTEKSRASHLKRCAAKLDVPAQTLLQAVQRQAVEAGAGLPPRVVGGKRRGVPKLKEPSKKRKVVKTGAEMEDLMVAMALSRSMQEDKNAQNTAGAQPSMELPTKGKKSRRKQKDKPTPLLLVQAPEETVMKLQKRLSMLLTEEAVENKEVMALPSSHFWTMEEEERESWRLRGGKRCLLWDISNMTEKRDTLSYYTAELNPPITQWKSPLKKLHTSQTRVTTAILHSEKPQSQTAIDKDPQPASCEDKSPFSDSQTALLDLADLAGEGMTLTQWNGGNFNERTGRESPGSITSSGFIPAQEEKVSNESHGLGNKIPLFVLSADFMEMVNNPHLSDAQLQTDCGEVLNAHMFVLYARCPLLVEAIHSEGFWVDESGMGRARRLLINDVSAEAALCFLRFLYAATTDFPSHCLPHVCELARRFGLKSLIDACERLVSGTYNTEGQLSTEEEGDDGGERAETFQELLKSMWLNEGEDIFENVQADREDEEKLDDGGVGEGELEEIYEFALTQRKISARQDSEGGSESEQEVEDPEKSDNNSPKSRNLSLEDKEKRDLISTTSLKASPRKSLMCILSNSPEYSVISPLSASTELKMQPSSSSSVTGASPVKKVSTSRNPSLSESPIPVISLISPSRDEDPEADMFAPQSPPPLDDSYDRMFSQTCGEYGETSDIGESKSQINPVSPEQPILTSSPTAMPCPSLPELGSSPNIKPQTHSFLDGPSYSVECGKSLHSSLRDSHHSTSTQNSKDTSPKASSQDADIILILSSDEEMESNDQAAPLTRSGQFDMPDIAKVMKESPVSFNQGRKSNEGFSRLEMSSSSEMSWLVPATPLPQNASSKISLLQTSCLSQSLQSLQKTTRAAKSPPNSQKTCHPGRSSQNSQIMSHPGRSPPNSQMFFPGCSHPNSPKASHPSQSPPNSQKTSHSGRSPPNSQKASHPGRSSQNSQIMSHPGRSPPNSQMFFPGCSHPNSQKASHPSQSPPNSQKTSHSGRSPPNSQKASHPGRSPQNSRKMSDPSWSPPNAMKMCDVAHSSPNSQKTPSAAQSPETLQKASNVVQSPPNSQQTPQSSPTSKNLDLDVSFQSCVSQTQASSVSLPLMSPKSPRTPSVIATLRTRKLQTGLEAQPSVSSKTTSSPSISISSSTVFEVVDSEDEAPVAEPQANISNTSFQFNYDELPIPMEEDLWCNVLETPRKPYPPSTRTPLPSNESPNKPLDCTPLSPSPAKSTTPASIEDSPQTTVHQSHHQSYLNSKLWEDWEDEDPELPAVLPLSQRLCKVPEVQKELRTPVSIVRRRELPPKVPITPLPDYSDMDTPVLKKELSKFGVRALPKKKMVLKLKEIFRYTHQVMNSDSEDDVPPSQPHRSVARALQKPTGDKQQPQHTTKGSSSSQSGRKGPSVCAAPEVETEDDQPLTASQESTTSSMGASDTSSLSQSANTNEFETAFADEDDDELVPASQAASKEALTAEAVRRFIEAQPELHQQILLYQPLDLAALHADLKQNGIRIAAGKLLDFLDSHCITFTTAAARKEKKSHTRRKARKRY
ncbi:LOW QUALITY PROTEIN: structure-specific endonuclease subunit SLX4 [Bufo gargarizans]|uniref:LOW QUALITY PROTEIN: structure-specific endonuclease subunit SLX4 n=1 Tax=Bufo gargarizans TaxID=30331 RepID=UPI001CF5AFD2|nr:LOW QUALITY PROTEIN: structure-specific endonuclease subunit SLX4 [Bufo gargarizans]